MSATFLTGCLRRCSRSTRTSLRFTFAVGSKGGVEPIVRVLERVVDGILDQPYTHVANLDSANAFNTMARRYRRRPPQVREGPLPCWPLGLGVRCRIGSGG